MDYQEAKFPVLVGEIAKRGIKKNAIAQMLDIDPRSLRNKMNGVSPFSWEEVNAIQNRFFPDMDLQDLFSYKDGA